MPPSPAEKLMARLDAFTAFTDVPGELTRLYLTRSHRAAADQFARWCADAGLMPWIDAAGSVRARYEGKTFGAPALMIGSHIDTVRNAGRFDGNLGALAALAVVEQLSETNVRLAHAIEIVAFGDEEGVRFPATLSGSRAIAGAFSTATLDQKDVGGITMRAALEAFGCEPHRVETLRRRDLAAFVELHIEQGPVLEAEGLALGVVSAINGASRFAAKIEGMAGHSGTVPMAMRRDALVATAEMTLAVEARANAEPDLVATVGRLDVFPGAVNVVPGETRFTIDVRAPLDDMRRRAVADISRSFHEIAARRKVGLSLVQTHDAPAYICHPRIVDGLSAAVSGLGLPSRLLPSGAGHDTMVMGAACPAGMLFVRCKGGVSHNPAESITLEDCGLALEALTRFAQAFTAD